MTPEQPDQRQRGESTSTGTSPSGRSSTVRTRPSGLHRLGSGIVAIPPVPFRDPADAVLADPSVPESRRFCGHCGARVGRGRDGAPGRVAGFCRTCGAEYAFEPKLGPGDVVGGQYEVVGCLAHGGMGWVYLARDRNVADRWVVLKGLLNAGDRDATAAALAERRFLAEVEHPSIVKIFNFVEHGTAGYIVMEYVGGRSLKQILSARREANGGEADPLPPAQAIAYVVEILPALSYLHDIGLLFCDFKLDHVIQTQHSLKLIDLGGVYRVDEPGAVFGTFGYQAPEVGSAGPSIPSDLFTVARTLALLCIDLPDYQSTHRFTIPSPDAEPRFERLDSLYRFLLKGTAPDPDDRFQSAEEMADQLQGVLREVVAAEEGRPVPGLSTLFTVPLRADIERPDWRILPRPQVARDDPGAGYLATITAGDAEETIAQLSAAPEPTVEVDLRLAAVMIESGEPAGAEELLAAIAARDRWEWRARWYRGVAELTQGRTAPARSSFAAVYHAVPGELAPKLALAVAAELDGDVAEAARWYEIVARTDPSITSASFGLGRCRLDLGDRDGALAAYELVPESSSGYIDAQTARIRCLATRNGPGGPTIGELRTAGSILEGLQLDGEPRDRLTAVLLDRALELTEDGNAVDDGSGPLLGYRFVERDVRIGLERSLRALARYAPSRAERIRLVDEANRVRPRTWT